MRVLRLLPLLCLLALAGCSGQFETQVGEPQSPTREVRGPLTLTNHFIQDYELRLQLPEGASAQLRVFQDSIQGSVRLSGQQLSLKPGIWPGEKNAKLTATGQDSFLPERVLASGRLKGGENGWWAVRQGGNNPSELALVMAFQTPFAGKTSVVGYELRTPFGSVPEMSAASQASLIQQLKRIGSSASGRTL